MSDVMEEPRAAHSDIRETYDRQAELYDRQRSRTLREARWLTRFGDALPRQGRVLDLGCGPVNRFRPG